MVVFFIQSKAIKQIVEVVDIRQSWEGEVVHVTVGGQCVRTSWYWAVTVAVSMGHRFTELDQRREWDPRPGARVPFIRWFSVGGC